HGRELGRMIVEGGDRAVDLDAPIRLELLGDLGVDVAVGPNDEVQPVDLAFRRLAPRPARLSEGTRRRTQCAQPGRAGENTASADLPLADHVIGHVMAPRDTTASGPAAGARTMPLAIATAEPSTRSCPRQRRLEDSPPPLGTMRCKLQDGCGLEPAVLCGARPAPLDCDQRPATTQDI